MCRTLFTFCFDNYGFGPFITQPIFADQDKNWINDDQKKRKLTNNPGSPIAQNRRTCGVVNHFYTDQLFAHTLPVEKRSRVFGE